MNSYSHAIAIVVEHPGLCLAFGQVITVVHTPSGDILSFNMSTTLSEGSLKGIFSFIQEKTDHRNTNRFLLSHRKLRGFQANRRA